MELTGRKLKDGKLLAVLLACAFIISVCCFGCSGSKKPETKDPAPANPVTDNPTQQKPAPQRVVKAKRSGTVYYRYKGREDFDLYQEPANPKSAVTDKVKAGDQFRILDEKDLHMLVETEDKRKGWIFKRNVAEYYFTEPEEKKDAKKPPVPDALAIFAPSFEENPVEPAIWYEVCPKTDLELHEFPHVKSPVVATAKANHRYLVTDTAMVGFPKLSYREFPNGVKGSHIVGLGFEASVFYHEGRVFETGLDSPYKAYSGFKNIEAFDPDFKNLGKYRNHWLRLQTEDGTEGWTKSYQFEKSKDEVWNRAFFFTGYGGLNMYLHVKEHPIKILFKTYKLPLYADSGKGSVAFTKEEQGYYGFTNSRVKVLEEKGEMSRIQSYKNGFIAWVPSRYLVDYKQAYWHKIEETREELKKRDTKQYSEFALREFPKESEKPKPDAAVIQTGVITGTEVRMRKSWSTKSDITGYFNKGEKVTILETKEGWHKVKRSDGSIGWVRGDLCKVVSE